MTTRLARIMDDITGSIRWDHPVHLEVNDRGNCIDSGPLDEIIDDLTVSFPHGRFVGVWDDNWSLIVCDD